MDEQDKQTLDEKLAPSMILGKMDGVLENLRHFRPEERGELSRRYAVCITDMEKVYAYFKSFIAEG